MTQTTKKHKAWTIAIKIKNNWWPIIPYCASTRKQAVRNFNENIAFGQPDLSGYPDYKPVKIMIEVLP